MYEHRKQVAIRKINVHDIQNFGYNVPKLILSRKIEQSQMKSRHEIQPYKPLISVPYVGNKSTASIDSVDFNKNVNSEW